MAPEISLIDPNMERVGHYRNTSTGEIVSIEGPNKGIYTKVHQDGKTEPLGTVVSDGDTLGLEMIV